MNVKRDLKEILTMDANLKICCTVLVNSLAVTLVVSMLTASLEGRERHLNARLEVRRLEVRRLEARRLIEARS